MKAGNILLKSYKDIKHRNIYWCKYSQSNFSITNDQSCWICGINPVLGIHGFGFFGIKFFGDLCGNQQENVQKKSELHAKIESSSYKTD